MNTIHHFHARYVFEKSFDVTYVALIPKKTGVIKLRYYRPISLISKVYKIIAKTLIERLKKVIDSLVDKHQMPFIKRRQTIDTAFIASEYVDTRLKGDAPGIMCKLDIKKAYDHVN